MLFSLTVIIYCAGLCCPYAFHMALHCVSITSSQSLVTFSLQRRCMGVLCCYFRPKVFSPGDRVHYHDVRVMQAEHVQPFKVCYSRTQKFFTVPSDPQ